MNLFRTTLLASAIAALAGCQSSPEKPADTPQQQLQTAPTPQAVRLRTAQASVNARSLLPNTTAMATAK